MSLTMTHGYALNQYQKLNQFSYSINLNQNYAWRLVASGSDPNQEVSFRAEINVMLTQFAPLTYSITMNRLSGSYPDTIPIDGEYGGWIWDNLIWDRPNTPATFNQLIYPTDLSYWSSRFGVQEDNRGNYVIQDTRSVTVFVGSFIEYTGSAASIYNVDADTGVLQSFDHTAELTSNRNENEIYDISFELEYQGSSVTDQGDEEFIDIMNVTLTSNNLGLFTTISWIVIGLALIGVIILNVRYFLVRDKN